MVQEAYMEKGSAVLWIGNAESLERVKSLLTTVDQFKAAKSLFNGEVSIVYEKQPDDSYKVIFSKKNDVFSYEEIENLVDKVSRVTGKKEPSTYTQILQDAATLLPNKHKIFLPHTNKPVYCLSVNMDNLLVRLIDEATSIEHYVKVMTKAMEDMPQITLDYLGNIVKLTGYVGCIDEFLAIFAKIFLTKVINEASVSKNAVSSLSQEISRLIICDIVGRELLSLENLASCDSSHPMSAHRAASTQARDLFAALLANPNITQLSAGNMAILRLGISSSGMYSEAPPILSRSFERLMTRIPKELAEKVRGQ